MKPVRMSAIGVVMVMVCAVADSRAVAASSDPIALIQTVEVKGISGRIGHLAVDTKRNRLFIAIVGTNNVEIIDLKTNKEVPPLTALGQPLDVAYLADFDLIAVSSAENGVVYFFNPETLKPEGNVSLGRNASHMQYDAAAKELFVIHGTGSLSAINVATRSIARTFEYEHTLNAFRLESSGDRLFINRSGNKDILVINRKTGQVLQTWDIEPLGVGGNMTMALDETNHRLFVGCRKPAKMLVFDTADGKLVKSIGLIVDCDDVNFDAALGCVYASCGGAEGTIDVFELKSPDDIVLSARVPTMMGGRTSTFDPVARRLYVMTPGNRGGTGQLMVFSVQMPAPPATQTTESKAQPDAKR